MNSLSKYILSVITVTYNAEQYIKTLLNSIAPQLNTTVQLIVIDGGSTDGTLRILEDHRHMINILVTEKDNGIYDAMNKGIHFASGEWLYFIGADDVLVDDVIPVFLTTVTGKIDTLLVYGDFIQVNRMGETIYRKQERVTAKYKMLNGCLNHQSIFFSKQLFERYGKYDTKYQLSADYDFLTKLPFEIFTTALKLPVPIAYYSTEGVSSRSQDQLYHERKSIIKKNFGPITAILYSFYLFIKQL